jgi:hypothetical protein
MVNDEDGRTADGTEVAAGHIARICASCVLTLPVSGAAVSVMTTDGHRGVVFATDATARRLEDVQFTLGAGVGVDAFATGVVQLIPDIGADGVPVKRSSTFLDAADELGVGALFAFPLRLGAASLGVLTLYRAETGSLDGRDLSRAVRLADTAAAALLDLMVNVPPDNTLTGQDGREAEFYRAEIYQAAGMVKEQLGVTIEVAMLRLRAYAFASGRPTGEVAHDIVNRQIRLEADIV